MNTQHALAGDGSTGREKSRGRCNTLAKAAAEVMYNWAVRCGGITRRT
jgi:hypothetical protein